MNKEAVVKKIIMRPIYCGDDIEWNITVEYIDGHKETTDARSFMVGGIVEMLDASARYAINPNGAK